MCDEEESHVALWAKIEKDLALNVPTYIKNITKLNGYNAAATFQLINEAKIAEMEIFARTEMNDFIDIGANKKDYYNRFYDNTSKFKFVSGHKDLILTIANYVKVKVGAENKNLSYFNKYCDAKMVTQFSQEFSKPSSSKQFLSTAQKSTKKSDHQPSLENTGENAVDKPISSDRDENANPRVDLNSVSAALYKLLKTWTQNRKELEKVMFMFISM